VRRSDGSTRRGDETLTSGSKKWMNFRVKLCHRLAELPTTGLDNLLIACRVRRFFAFTGPETALGYSQMTLQMKREALKKLNRKANEGQAGFDTERPN
jgi:hypothetical protein